jgi:hypothetical protein
MTEEEKDAATEEMLADMEKHGELHQAVAPIERRLSEVFEQALETKRVSLCLLLVVLVLCLAVIYLWQRVKTISHSVGAQPPPPEPERKPIGFLAHATLSKPKNETERAEEHTSRL